MLLLLCHFSNTCELDGGASCVSFNPFSLCLTCVFPPLEQWMLQRRQCDKVGDEGQSLGRQKISDNWSFFLVNVLDMGQSVCARTAVFLCQFVGNHITRGQLGSYKKAAVLKLWVDWFIRQINYNKKSLRPLFHHDPSGILLNPLSSLMTDRNCGLKGTDLFWLLKHVPWEALL